MDYTACMGLRSTRLWKSLMNMALGTALMSGTKHKELWSDPDSLLLWISNNHLHMHLMDPRASLGISMKIGVPVTALLWQS